MIHNNNPFLLNFICGYDPNRSNLLISVSTMVLTVQLFTDLYYLTNSILLPSPLLLKFPPTAAAANHTIFP